MSAAIAEGTWVPATLREFACDVIRRHMSDDLTLDGPTALERLLVDETLREPARLALRIEVQTTIASAVRHAGPYFEREFDAAAELSRLLWSVGLAREVSWTDDIDGAAR